MKSKTKEALNFATFFFSHFFHFIFTIVCRVSAAPGQRGPDKKIAKIAEHRLLQDIIYTDSYNREVRPALRDSDVVTVLFEVKLVQIVDVVSDVMELYMCEVYIPVEVTTAAFDGHLKVHKVVVLLKIIASPWLIRELIAMPM